MKDAAVYAVGNGSVIAYGREMDWIQVFGSPYTIPTVFSLTPAVPVTAATERVLETNVWRHTCREGVLTDAAPRDPACLLRTWSLREPAAVYTGFPRFSRGRRDRAVYWWPHAVCDCPGNRSGFQHLSSGA